MIGTETYRNSVAEIRKKLSRVAKKRLVFIDGSGLRSEPRPLKGLAPAGQTGDESQRRGSLHGQRIVV